MNFVDKVVLVTGAGSGIGAATAKLFAQLGATLVLIDKDPENLNKVAEECKISRDIVPLTLKVDLRSEAETKHLIESVMSQLKHLDVVVNNAGIWEAGALENSSLEQFDRIFNTNVRAMYYLTKLAAPHLIASKGSIVNVSSIAGRRAFVGSLVYNMSKSAVEQFTRCVALELAPKGVRVNSVNPSILPTVIRQNGMIDADSEQFLLERSVGIHPMGRLGTTQEVAKAIAFLASDDASFSTGGHFFVDGGRHVFAISPFAEN